MLYYNITALQYYNNVLTEFVNIPRYIYLSKANLFI